MIVQTANITYQREALNLGQRWSGFVGQSNSRRQQLAAGWHCPRLTLANTARNGPPSAGAAQRICTRLTDELRPALSCSDTILFCSIMYGVDEGIPVWILEGTVIDITTHEQSVSDSGARYRTDLCDLTQHHHGRGWPWRASFSRPKFEMPSYPWRPPG